MKLAGIHLEQNEPARRQWDRRSISVIRSQIVVHTAEGFMAGTLAWLVSRDTAGSYHALADFDHWKQTVGYRHAAYHVRGHNTRTLGLSFATYAKNWRGVEPVRRTAMLRQGAEAANDMADFLEGHGKPRPAARLLTLEQFKAGEPGFISHALLDPQRRTDPGSHFPWVEFFALYNGTEFDPTRTATMPATADPEVAAWQQALNGAGATPPLVVDGDFGPKTLATSWKLYSEANRITTGTGLGEPPQTSKPVTTWQRALHAWRPIVKADGDFGPKTLAASVGMLDWWKQRPLDTPDVTQPIPDPPRMPTHAEEIAVLQDAVGRLTDQTSRQAQQIEQLAMDRDQLDADKRELQRQLNEARDVVSTVREAIQELLSS